MHSLVQDGDDANFAIAEPPPVHEVALIAEEVPFHPELGRHGPRHDAPRFDMIKRGEQARDVTLRLRLSPSVAGEAVDLVEAH